MYTHFTPSHATVELQSVPVFIMNQGNDSEHDKFAVEIPLMRGFNVCKA
jgi:hypothetical protein